MNVKRVALLALLTLAAAAAYGWIQYLGANERIGELEGAVDSAQAQVTRDSARLAAGERRWRADSTRLAAAVDSLEREAAAHRARADSLEGAFELTYQELAEEIDPELLPAFQRLYAQHQQVVSSYESALADTEAQLSRKDAVIAKLHTRVQTRDLLIASLQERDARKDALIAEYERQLSPDLLTWIGRDVEKAVSLVLAGFGLAKAIG